MSACVASRPADTPVSGGGATIAHALGSARIASPPVRVVTLGAADTQIATALGAQVVGAVRNPARADGNWPGVSPLLPEAVTNLDSVDPDVGRIAALHPDLILATTAQSAYTDRYEVLSAIAPTVAYFDRPLRDSGEVLVDRIGAALFREQEAGRLLASSRRAIDEHVRTHPGLRGRTVAFGQYSAGTTFLVADQQSQTAQFLRRLTMSIPREFTDMLSTRSGSGPYGMLTPSVENLGVLDHADLVLVSVFGGSPEDFSRLPTVAASAPARAGNLHVIPVDLAAVLLQPNPATTRYALAGLSRRVGGLS